MNETTATGSAQGRSILASNPSSSNRGTPTDNGAARRRRGDPRRQVGELPVGRRWSRTNTLTQSGPVNVRRTPPISLAQSLRRQVARTRGSRARPPADRRRQRRRRRAAGHRRLHDRNLEGLQHAHVATMLIRSLEDTRAFWHVATIQSAVGCASPAKLLLLVSTARSTITRTTAAMPVTAPSASSSSVTVKAIERR